MTIQTFVTFKSSSEVTKIHMGDHEILETLGPREEAIAVQLKELLRSVEESVREDIEEEAELTVEITGSLEMKASGGIQYLLFNVGTGASKNNSMKVTFSTKISPKD